MKIACEKCGTVFEVDAAQIPAEGLHMKCTSCFHPFTVPPATIDLPGGENADFILTNNPADFAAPSGYVDPTTKDITAYEETKSSGDPVDIMDLPGLPGERAPAEVMDLPGLPQQKKPSPKPVAPRPTPAIAPPAKPSAPAEIMDLPGLPSQKAPAEITDLPGLPRERAPAEITDLPGLPRAGRPAEISDLPGLPRGAGGRELMDLPGLPSTGPAGAGGEIADLPGLPQSAHAPPVSLDLADLPGLPSGGAVASTDLPDLPGLPSGGANSDLADLPPPAAGGGIAATSDMDYGEVSLDIDEGDALSVDLDEIPVGAAGDDLPPPARAAGRGGADFDLPMPVRSTTTEAPAQISDLPTPSRPADRRSAREPADEVISFEVPLMEDDVVPAPTPEPVASQPVTAAPTEEATAPTSRGLKLPSKKVMIVAAAAVAVLALGGVLAMVLLGGDGKKGVSATTLTDAKQKLSLDTYAGYGQAARAFEEVGAKLEGAPRTEALALQAQALASRAHRFDARPSLRDAQIVLDKLATEEPPQVLKVANALLELAHGKTATAKAQLVALSNARPKDARAALYSGWAQLAANDLSAAHRAFQRAYAADPTLFGALFGLAEVAAQQKKSKAALAACDKLLAANQGHAGAILLKAQILVEQKHFAAAKPLTERVIKLSRSGAASRGEIATAHAVNSQIALGTGDVNGARGALAKAVKFNPRSRIALLGSAQLALRAKRFGEAANFLQRLKNLDPSNLQTTLLLAETMLSLGKPIDARDAIKAARKAHAKDARVHFMVGRIEDSLGAYDNAVVAYKRAIKLEPNFFAPYLYLSRLHLRRKQSSLAFGVLTQAETVLKNAEVRNAIGEAHAKSGDLKKAREKFEEALAMDAKLDIALFNLANALRDLGQQKEALARYQRLAKRDRSFPGLAASMGKLYLLMNEPQKAAAAYQEALEIDRPSVALRLAAARAFVSAGKFDDCLKQATAVIEEKPTSAAALALRAEANLGRGKAQEALVEIRRAADRDNKASYHAVMARAYEKLGKIPAAVLAYNTAIKIDPKNLDYHLHRARLQVRAGAVKDGLGALNKLIAADPKLAAAQLYKGIALLELGKEAQGRASLRAAVSLDPKLGEAHYRLALLLLDNNQAAKAYSHLEVATTQGKKGDYWLANACFRFGQLALGRGAKEKAANALKRFIELAHPRDANLPTAKGLLKKLGGAAKAPAKPPTK